MLRRPQELEPLNPILTDELEQAADMPINLRSHCERLNADEESRYDLVKLVVERAYDWENKVVAMTLRSNYHLVLNHKTAGPTEFSVDPAFVTYGSDGSRPLTCKTMMVIFLPGYIRQDSLLQISSYTDSYHSVNQQFKQRFPPNSEIFTTLTNRNSTW